MSSSQVDCHFFLKGTCLKGDKCQFRHSERARQTADICPAFKETGQCPEDDCGKRHTVEQIVRTTKAPAEIPCRNEENGGVCTRPDCIFKHARRATQPTMAGVRPPRPSASDSGGNRLNAGAKAFVPMGKLGQQRPPVRPRPNMEWTPDSGSNKVQVRSFGDKQWRPSARGNQGMTARPPMRSFANREWTPASAAASTKADSGAKANAFAAAGAFGGGSRGFGQSSFGSKESAFGNLGKGAFASSTAGIMHRPQTDMSPADEMTMADTDIDKEQEGEEGMDVDAAQDDYGQPLRAQVQARTQTFTRIQRQQPPLPQALQAPQAAPFSNAPANKSPAFSKPPTSAKSSIPSIFDILGIEEQKPMPIERQRRSDPEQNTQPLPHQADSYKQTDLARSAALAIANRATEPISDPNPDPKSEPAPDPAVFKYSSVQQDAQAASGAQKPIAPPSCDRSMNNSPLSNVCYASEFPGYMGIGLKQRSEVPPRPRTPEPMSISVSEAESNVDTDVDAGADTEGSLVLRQGYATDTAKMEKEMPLPLKPAPKVAATLSLDASAPKPASSSISSKNDDTASCSGDNDASNKSNSDTATGGGGSSSNNNNNNANSASTQLPKILSFQEIMERKRRKQAEAARLAGGNADSSKSAASDSAASKPISNVNSNSDSSSGSNNKKPASLHSTPAKRRVISDGSDEADSDASEGKRVKASLVAKRPEMTNYVAMFEKELADMNIDLSGPLKNSPANDRISKANIKDSYFDADLTNILNSK